jgi:ribosomal protein L11 methyltransferase
MKQWNYLQASFHPADSEKASAILWSLGTQGIEENPLQSSRLRVKAYFDLRHDIQLLQQEFETQCERAGIRLLSCSLRTQSERDWFKKWRRQLQPFTVGRHFQIIPSQEAKSPASTMRLTIYLEPGMAFGTGTHETTHLCLEALEHYLPSASACVDIGTGSGILAIAAVKLGATKVLACDLDPIAVEIAAANAKRNGCHTKIRFVLGDVDQLPKLKPDVLVGNLTVELIEQEFRKFERRLKPGSWLILSGVLNEQAFRVEVLRRKSSLEFAARKKKNDWTCLIYRKPLPSDLRSVI